MKDYILRLKNEAHNWENASPIGAGSIGAMVFGNPGSERYCLNEETIWNGDKQDACNHGYIDNLRKARAMFLDGKNAEAEKWAQENLQERNYAIKSYEFAGDLFVDVHGDSEKDSYERLLDLKNGLLNINYEMYGIKYSRECFASHPAKLLCMRLDTEPDRLAVVKFRRAYVTSPNAYCYEGNGYIDFVCATVDGGHKFRVTVKIVSDGDMYTDDYDVLVENSTKIEMFVSIVTEFRDPEMDTMKYIALADKGYDALKAEHVADFSAIMGRSDIDFGDDGVEDLSIPRRLRRLKSDNDAMDRGLISLYFQFGKYLLVSSSREDTYPANLQGLWCEGYECPWNCDYHTNINLEMNYWHAEIANITECNFGLFNYMNKCLLPSGRITAKENYKSRGCVLHHFSDIYGFTSSSGTLWGIWTLGAAWLAHHMWEHYLFTKDEKFLRETAYEFIRDAAVFFVDVMFEGPDGVVYSGPSNSPENNYIFEHNGEKAPVRLSLSPTMDIQIIGGILDIYAQVENILGISPETAEEVRAVRAKMPRMQIGKYGQLQEWIEDYEENDLGHRHISHAFGLYPAAQITRDTPDLFKAVEVTLHRRLAHGGGGTGWSRAWLINLFARLKNCKNAYNNIRDLLTKSTLHNLLANHPPFQIDGNFGGAAGIAEMLMQSHEGFIALIPAISEELKDGSFEGLCARGGYTISAKWADLKVTEFTVNGAADTALVELPESQADCTFVTEDGVEITANGRMITVPCGKTVSVR